MSEENEKPLFQEQKKVRQRIEDALSDSLSGDIKETALDFVAYLRLNKMSPAWTSPNSWKVSYKSNGVCYIKLGYGSWQINFHGSFNKDYENIFTDVKVKETAWANVKYCIKCNANCIAAEKWEHASVLGKEFDNLCKNIRIVMLNPGTEAIVCAKKLAEKSCEDIMNAKSVW